MNAYCWSELRKGMSQEFEELITPAMVRDFLCLSGDCNLLHADQEFAIQAGFPRPVVHGLLTSALYSRLVGVYLPGRYCVLHKISIDFVKPAYVGDKLHVFGTVIHLSDAYRRAELKATIHNERGVLSRAMISVGVNEH